MKKLILIILFFSPSIFALPQFNTININGRMNVRLVQVSAKKKTSVSSSRKIDYRVHNKTLYIRSLPQKKYNPRPIRVTVRLRQIKKLDVFNTVNIKASRLNSPALKLNTDNRGKIKLKGKLAVTSIRATGSSIIDLGWVNSDALKIYAVSNARIKLAGTVKELNVRLFGHSTLDAKYLRAQNIMVQTKNYAIAKLMPMKSLQAFAANHSNIYYYKWLKNITRDTTQSGNILQAGSKN